MTDPAANLFNILSDPDETRGCCSPSSGCCGIARPSVAATSLTRRDFLARTGAASIALLLSGLPRWAAGSGEVILSPHLIPKEKNLNPGWLKSLTHQGNPTVCSGETARTIGMPVGGIGAGQIYLCGDGTLGLWEIFNEHTVPAHGALSYARRTIPKPVRHGLGVYWKSGNSLAARMLDQTGFENAVFRNTHPVGRVAYDDPSIPLKVTLEAFSPFIPLNAKDSGLPATIMAVTIENTSTENIEVGTASWLENPIARLAHADSEPGTRHTIITRSDKSGRISHRASAASDQATPPREPIVFQDFESSNFGDWKTEGTAFGDKPTTGNLPTQQNVSGWEGSGFAGSFRERDATTGKLVSPEFTIERRYINFLVGGGRDKAKVGIHLYIDGEKVREAGGTDNEVMEWRHFSVRELEGKRARLEIIDQSTGGWGHTQVDHIEFADTRRQGGSRAGFEDYSDYGTLSWGVDRPLQDEVTTASTLAALGPHAHDVQAASDSGPITLEKSWCAGIATQAIQLQPGEKLTITHTLAWHFPNTVQPSHDAGHYYAALYNNADEVMDYVHQNQERLVSHTLLWRDTYYNSTLPWWLLERMHMTSCCLATGTTMWWKNGRFWAFEGVTCCVGTCTHVYNYVQTTSRLFPELERNLREQQDLKPGVGLEPDGLVGFRHDGKYAADGQCGTVLKVYREHRMSADDSFLKSNWEATRKVLDYAISQDGNSDGILEGRQHNTYDVDFYGANTFVGALYLAALRAGEEMARELGDNTYADQLHAIYEKGRAWTEANLWTGEYFKQIVDLKEHKLHQYGDGCLSDQLFGQNWAHQLNLGYIYDPAKVTTALKSIWDYNWAPDLGIYNAEFPAQRVFAESQEAGLFNCTWPHSRHLDDGVLYRDEVWSGVEYQVASHMIYEGMITEGLAVTRAVHDRYSPERRNPFNEIECSDFYSRAMASWGLLLALSGFDYHGPKGQLTFNPRISPEDFRCAFNTAEGWGTYSQKDTASGRVYHIELAFGKLTLVSLTLTTRNPAQAVTASFEAAPIATDFKVSENQATLTFSPPLQFKAGQVIRVMIS